MRGYRWLMKHQTHTFTCYADGALELDSRCVLCGGTVVDLEGVGFEVCTPKPELVQALLASLTAPAPVVREIVGNFVECTCTMTDLLRHGCKCGGK